MYDKLAWKVNNIDISGFALKSKYDTDKSDLKKKISDADKEIFDTSEIANNFVKKTVYNAKLSEIESKIPSISSLATNSGLTAVENKIPNISSLVKKQIIMQKYHTWKRKLLIMILINILLLQNLIT